MEPGGSEVPAVTFPCTRCVRDACLPGVGGDLNGVLVEACQAARGRHVHLFLTSLTVTLPDALFFIHCALARTWVPGCSWR